MTNAEAMTNCQINWTNSGTWVFTNSPSSASNFYTGSRYFLTNPTVYSIGQPKWYEHRVWFKGPTSYYGNTQYSAPIWMFLIVGSAALVAFAVGWICGRAGSR